jgi:hypothetical protein
MGQRFSSHPKHPEWLWGPPSSLFSGYLVFFPGVKCLRYEFDHFPSTAEVKIDGGVALLPLHVFVGQTGTTLPSDLCM